MRWTATLFLAATLTMGAPLATVESANAMPIAPLSASESAAPVQEVGWRCGPGWHINPWGRCVPNRHWGYGGGWRRGGWHRGGWHRGGWHRGGWHRGGWHHGGGHWRGHRR